MRGRIAVVPFTEGCLGQMHGGPSSTRTNTTPPLELISYSLGVRCMLDDRLVSDASGTFFAGTSIAVVLASSQISRVSLTLTSVLITNQILTGHDSLVAWLHGLRSSLYLIILGKIPCTTVSTVQYTCSSSTAILLPEFGYRSTRASLNTYTLTIS